MSIILAPPNLHDLIPLLDGRVRPPLRMTEEEFEEWASPDTRAEWVDGEVILMSPSNLRHSRLNIWLVHILAEFLVRRPLGEILSQEFTVRFAAQRRRRVPDILFLAKERAGLLRQTYLDGAPDLIIEIVSPESQSRDRREKYVDYEKAGVREYWIIDPLSETVEAYSIGANGSFGLIAEDTGRIRSLVLPSFSLDAKQLWQDPLPPVRKTLAEMGID